MKKHPKPPAAVGPPQKSQIPPCPEGHPAMGDKTPEVMRWWQTHFPEEFEERYGHRVHPLNHLAMDRPPPAPPGPWDTGFGVYEDEESRPTPPRVFF
ncbi:MAG: hypothetical protein ACAI34_20235 [Verrucomicrobium sp.]|nr:hypothetical protein [Verrucomicrobium sp.]